MEQFIDISKQVKSPIYCANPKCGHRIVDISYGHGVKKCEKCGFYTDFDRLDGITKTSISVKKK